MSQREDDIEAGWRTLEDAQSIWRDQNPDDPDTPPPVEDDGDPRCVGGCGYPVERFGDLCGECACEDDGAIY
jgi:hypothetical protein